jgi:hypothetical protein
VCGGVGGDGVGAVDIKVSDSSSALSFSSSLSADSCHFLTTVKYEVLQSIALALLILVSHVFSEQYVPCSGQIYVAEITQGNWSISRLFCSISNSGIFGLHYSCLTQIYYSLELLLASSLFLPFILASLFSQSSLCIGME